MRYCEKCGEQLSETAAFCSKCGAAVVLLTPEVATSPQVNSTSEQARVANVLPETSGQQVSIIPREIHKQAWLLPPSKKLLYVNAIILSLLILSVVSVPAMFVSINREKVQATPKSTQAPLEITAGRLADDFDTNAVAAKAKWSGKLVEFSSQISNITSSGISFSNVASKQLSITQIACRTSGTQQLMMLRNGQTITVRGIVADQTMGVIEIKNCVVVF